MKGVCASLLVAQLAGSVPAGWVGTHDCSAGQRCTSAPGCSMLLLLLNRALEPFPGRKQWRSLSTS